MSLPPENRLEHFLRANPDVRLYLRMERRIILLSGVGAGILVCIIIKVLS